MTPAERSARAYCHSINADPDEAVLRWYGHGRGGGFFAKVVRWHLYVGAVIQHNHAAE